VKLWVDDLREPDSSWTWVKCPGCAIKILKLGAVTELSLDHDLGGDLTTREIVLWMAEEDL
jgi:hypothetical protein